MSKALTNPSFDYSPLAKDDASKLIWYAAEIQKQDKTHVESGMKMGQLLFEARSILEDKQSFREWVERECKYSIRSAYNYISAWENFGECANFAHIELSAMYALTSNEGAKKKALKMADRGEKVTHETAKRLIKATPPKRTSGEDGGRDSGGTEQPEEPGSRPPRKGRDKPADLGQCPNCAGSRWKETDDGYVCSKCKHPHGEATGGADDDRVATQRSKTVKTVEALMRAFDDLHLLLPGKQHKEAIDTCKSLLKIAKGWK